MNRKDLATFKRQLKEAGKVTITHLGRVFAMGDSKEILYHEAGLFSTLDEAEQALYFSNFKKLLSGPLDSKVFELPFLTTTAQSHSGDLGQGFLYDMLNENVLAEFEAKGVQLAQKILEVCPFEGEVVFNFVKADYLKPFKKSAGPGEDDFEGADDTVYKMKVLLFSINRLESSETAVRFDYRDRRFKIHQELSAVLNLNSPLEGFMFPSLVDDAADVNHVVYSAPKAEQLNLPLIESVLNAGVTRTASEEKAQFDTLVRTMVGETAKPEVVKSIYEAIDLAVADLEGDETPVVEMVTLEKALRHSGVNTAHFQNVVSEVAGDSQHFKPDNVVPGYRKKSLKISTTAADIALCPEQLDAIRQVIDSSGRKYLMIEIDEEIEINGIQLELEKL